MNSRQRARKRAKELGISYQQARTMYRPEKRPQQTQSEVDDSYEAYCKRIEASGLSFQEYADEEEEEAYPHASSSTSRGLGVEAWHARKAIIDKAREEQHLQKNEYSRFFEGDF